jgi:hypothetical protein
LRILGLKFPRTPYFNQRKHSLQPGGGLIQGCRWTKMR